MKRFISIILLFTALSVQLKAQTTENQIRNDINFLASPALKGRFPGTNEDTKTVAFIQQRLEALGLKPLFNQGIQDFNVVTSVEAAPDNMLSINNIPAVYGTDFSLFSFSGNESFEAEIVFAGFGMKISTDSLIWNDYEGLDVKNKWVLILKGDPEPANNNSKFIPFADARTKVMFAKDQGAKGVIFTGGIQNNKADELVPLLFERAVISAGIPVIDVKRSFMNSLLAQNQCIDSLEVAAAQGKKIEAGKLLASAKVALIRNEVTTHNIAYMLEGSHPVLKDEYIIIGAHYDHLGMGGQGSGSRTPDTLAPHVGADDNASGVAMVLELARRFAADRAPNRSLIFALFGAEEMGLLGSAHLSRNLPVAKQNIVAMLNYDMVGRLNESNAVAVGGTGTAVETEALLNSLAEDSPLKFSYSPEGFGASDHASFYAIDLPVMFFSTGAHSDYHTPADTPDKINYQGMNLIADHGQQLIAKLANRDQKLTFREAGPKERTSGRRGFKVVLGIMPDFTSTATDGLGVGGVTKGGPADRAGMKKGDKITGLNGMPVGTIYDYMNRLKQLKPGQRVNVDIVRAGEPMIMIVDL